MKTKNYIITKTDKMVGVYYGIRNWNVCKNYKW